jgi:ribosomal RNA-processing protein 12
MAGLISPHSPTMSSATLLAISRLCLEFKENLAGLIIDELLSTLILVLQSKERQIVQSALSFCRVLLIILNETVLSKYIEQLVNYFVNYFFYIGCFFFFFIRLVH